MSTTPRTDAAEFDAATPTGTEKVVARGFARLLEKELSAEKARADECAGAMLALAHSYKALRQSLEPLMVRIRDEAGSNPRPHSLVVCHWGRLEPILRALESPKEVKP